VSQYACSDRANWQPFYNFTDRVPKGNIASTLEVTVLGSYACAGTNTVTLAFYLNGSPINMVELEKSSEACACNTCDGPVTTSFTSSFGFPGYVYGGATNTLEVRVQPSGQTVCLNQVKLTVDYTPLFQLASVAQVLDFSDTGTGSSTGERCTDGRFTHIQSSAIYSFSDPLPADQLLIAASVTLYGRYFSTDSGCQANVSASVSIQDQLVGESTIVAKQLQPPYVADPCASMCNGDWVFTSSSVYQNGWPGYDYGRVNLVHITPSTHIDVNYVVVQLFYFPAPTVSSIAIN
jgi:hypothetical protein